MTDTRAKRLVALYSLAGTTAVLVAIITGGARV